MANPLRYGGMLVADSCSDHVATTDAMNTCFRSAHISLLNDSISDYFSKSFRGVDRPARPPKAVRIRYLLSDPCFPFRKDYRTETKTSRLEWMILQRGDSVIDDTVRLAPRDHLLDQYRFQLASLSLDA